jgi:hypothetical protein
MTTKTDRFMREYNTAARVQFEANKRGAKLTLEQAHEVWAEHSDDYCAEWLAPDAENPVAEIRRAITAWQHRRAKR